jgi:hypothetical protein
VAHPLGQSLPGVSSAEVPMPAATAAPPVPLQRQPLPAAVRRQPGPHAAVAPGIALHGGPPAAPQPLGNAPAVALAVHLGVLPAHPVRLQPSARLHGGAGLPYARALAARWVGFPPPPAKGRGMWMALRSTCGVCLALRAAC